MRGFLHVSAFALFRNARIARRASFSKSDGSSDLNLPRQDGIELGAERFLRKELLGQGTAQCSRVLRS